MLWYICAPILLAVASQLRNILYLYVGGTTGVLLWKM